MRALLGEGAKKALGRTGESGESVCFSFLLSWFVALIVFALLGCCFCFLVGWFVVFLFGLLV